MTQEELEAERFWQMRDMLVNWYSPTAEKATVVTHRQQVYYRFRSLMACLGLCDGKWS